MDQQYFYRCANFQPNEGDRIIMHIKDARRHEGGLTCLHCDAPVVACKGNKNIHHFRHKANTSECAARNGSNGMSVEHRAAQIKMLKMWDDNDCIQLLIKQNFCDCSDNVINLMDFRRDGNIMVAEYKQKHNDRKISWDLAIISLHGSFIFGIEIAETHRTCETSRPDTENWCELLASEVNHDDFRCIPINCKRVRPLICEFCLFLLRRKQERLEQVQRFQICTRQKLEEIELNKKREKARLDNCLCVNLSNKYRCLIHDVRGFLIK